MKGDQYIPHDVSMRSNSQVMNLIEGEGAGGYGIYWALLEYLRTQDDYKGDVQAVRGVARQLKARIGKVMRVLEEYDLFVIKGCSFYSSSLMERMQPLERKRAQEQVQESVRTLSQNVQSLSQNEETLSEAACNSLETSNASSLVKKRKVKESKASTASAWEAHVDALSKEQQWIEIMAMRSGLGRVLVQRFPEVLRHFKRHVQAVGNEKDIQSPGDAKRYFCFYNTPGSAPFRLLVEELQKPVDRGKYRYEERDPVTGRRSYCGVAIPEGAPPRPNSQAVWSGGKWIF